MRKAVMNNTEQAAIVSRELEKLGFEIPPTWANFLYWELGHDALDFARRLEREGVRVQPLGSWGAPRAVRVTIGTPQENQTFLAAANSVAGNR
jgi:histidinol-phosphate aminotransferase